MNREPALCECGCGRPAPIATRTDRRSGWVKGCPMRFVLGHARRKNVPDYIPSAVHFFRGEPCWLWNRGINVKTGYGATGTSANAHRVVYEKIVGPIPAGLTLDHLCRNKACVNPSHMEPVSHAENQRRSKPFNPPQKGPGRKLAADKVSYALSSPASARIVARELNVSATAIRLIRQGAQYREIPR